MALKVRPLTAQEADAVKRCASSRMAPHRVVQRVQIIWASVQEESVPDDETARGAVIALARTTPRSLGLPYALWTLARLQQALQERHGLHVTSATIWKWLQAEGLVWKRQQSWFQVQDDAAFVEKRGPSSRPTCRRSPSGGSSASTSWAP